MKREVGVQQGGWAGKRNSQSSSKRAVMSQQGRSSRGVTGFRKAERQTALSWVSGTDHAGNLSCSPKSGDSGIRKGRREAVFRLTETKVDSD